MRRTCALIFLIGSLSLLISCGGSKATANTDPGAGGSPTPATLTGVTVSPNSTSVSVAATVSFRAIGTYSDGSTKDLTSSAQWSSSNSAIASVASTGVVTGMASGSATISAQSGGMTGNASLTVNPASGGGSGSGSGGGAGGAASADLTAIAVTPATPTIAVNTVQQMTATGTYSDGSTADLTSIVAWSSSSASATVNATGAVTGVTAGTATITATLDTVSGTDVVTVTAPLIVDISVSPDGLTVPLGITQQFTATATYSDGSSQDLTAGVTWSSSSTSVATIDNTGLATILSAGSTTITATVGSLSDTATLTVVGANLTSIVVSPASASIAAGNQQQFTATGFFDDGSTELLPTVQWSSSSQTALTIDANGLATAIAAGPATVTATSGSVSGTASITVTSATLVSLAIAPLSPSMPVNAAKQFTATGTFSDSSTLDMTNTVLWKSSNASVAAINAQGLATSAAVGTTTVQAAWGSVTQSTTLTVANIDLVSIAISPANPHIEKRTQLKLTVVATYSDGSTAVLTTGVSWKTSKPSVAQMRGNGIVRAKKTGTVTITAKAFGLTGTTTLTIGSGTLVSVEITPANTSVSAGATQQYAATGTFSDGSTQDVTLNAHWSSTAASVATIANAPSVAGVATTYKAGVTTIGVNMSGNTNTTSLTVN